MERCSEGEMQEHCMSKAMIVHPRFRHTLALVNSTSSRGSLGELSLDALRLVAKNLSDEPRDVLRLETVAKICWVAANDERLWRDVCVSKFCVPPQTRPPSWKALYRFNHEFFHKVILSYATDRLMQSRLGGLAHGAAFHIPVLA